MLRLKWQKEILLKINNLQPQLDDWFKELKKIICLPKLHFCDKLEKLREEMTKPLTDSTVNDIENEVSESYGKLNAMLLGRGCFGEILMLDPGILKSSISDSCFSKNVISTTMALKCEAVRSSASLKCCLMEAELHKKSTTPAILFSSHKEKNLHFCLTKWGGVSLKKYMQSFPYSQPIKYDLKHFNLVKATIFSITKQLDNLHQSNIAHKDVKPDNILINPCTGVASIIDFGLAEYGNQSGSFQQFGGTLFYQAPEVLSQMAHTSKVDVWSLGLVLLELLSREYAISVISKNKFAPIKKGDTKLKIEKKNA